MKLVFTAAVMDMFHEGHYNLLKRMKEKGDLVLVVLHEGFTTFRNKKKFPVETLEKRTRNLINCGMVDMVRYTYEEEPHNTFRKIIQDYGEKFELLFMRGDDWKDFPGKETIDEYHIPILYAPYTHGISSTKRKQERLDTYKNPRVPNFRNKAHADIRDIDRILKQNGIEYFLSAGTMLGAVREGDFIEHDWDIDLCSMKYPEDEVQLQVASDFRLAGFEAEFQCSEKSGRLKLKRNVDTDIHFFEKQGRLAMCKVWGKPFFSIPMEYIEFRKAKLGDYEYDVISDKYLDSVYSDWKTPMKDDYFKPGYYYYETE